MWRFLMLAQSAVKAWRIFLTFSQAFAWEVAPDTNQVAIVSNAGGPAVVQGQMLWSVGLLICRTSLKRHGPQKVAACFNIS
jgi:acyl-CoA synthetase (NDP forming)